MHTAHGWCAPTTSAPLPSQFPYNPPSTQRGFSCTKRSVPLTPRPRISATEVVSGHRHASPCSDLVDSDTCALQSPRELSV